MTTRDWMIVVAEAAAVLGLAVLMDASSGAVWAGLRLFAIWILGVAAYLVRLAGRTSSRTGTATLGLIAAGIFVYLGMSLVIPPPLVPMIAGAVLAAAMVREGHRRGTGWLLSRILTASGGLVYLAFFVRALR